MFEVIKRSYETFVDTSGGRREGHATRLFCFALVAVFLSLLETGQNVGAFAIMATAITILTGFVFTAVFSSVSLGGFGLPNAENETEVYQLGRLFLLGQNFLARSRYFVFLAVVETALLSLVGLDLIAFGDGAELLSLGFLPQHILEMFDDYFFPSLYKGMVAAVFFIFFELLYLYYRIFETAFKITTLRSSFVSGEFRKS